MAKKERPKTASEIMSAYIRILNPEELAAMSKLVKTIYDIPHELKPKDNNLADSLVAFVSQLSQQDFELLGRLFEFGEPVVPRRQPMGCSFGPGGFKPLYSLEDEDPFGGPGDLG